MRLTWCLNRVTEKKKPNKGELEPGKGAAFVSLDVLARVFVVHATRKRKGHRKFGRDAQDERKRQRYLLTLQDSTEAGT